MPLKVQVTTPQSANVVIRPAAKINIDVGRYKMEPVNLEDLKNVDKTTNGLHTDDIVMYDEVTKTWITQPDNDDLDGGTY